MSNDTDGKLDQLILTTEINKLKLDTIEKTLVGDMESNGKVGLLERIRQIEKWIAKREWFEKLVIAAVIVNLVGLVFVLVQMIVTP